MTTGAPVRPGEVVGGKYRVERVLGRGGMGVVVAATHLQLGGKVALKFLLADVASRPDVVARFEREARTAASITSEHVAHVHDVGALPSGVPYLVMEYLEGMDLGRLLREHGPRPVSEAVDYILQACEALAEAHALGVVHRDLKPENLFLSRRADGSSLIKVLDFGISKVATGTGLTESNDMFGSPSYMAPEQMQNPKGVDGRADLWATGVILYQLLTGTLPFGGDTPAAQFVAALTTAPTPVRYYRPDLPAALESAVMGCFARDPRGRFQTVGELSRALGPFGTEASRLSVQRVNNMPAPAPFGPFAPFAPLAPGAGPAPFGADSAPRSPYAVPRFVPVAEAPPAHGRGEGAPPDGHDSRRIVGLFLALAAASLLVVGTLVVVLVLVVRGRFKNASVASDEQGLCAKKRQADACDRQCSAGNAASCDTLGFMYDNGKGVAKDEARSCELFKRACEGKHAYGCNNFGTCFVRAQGPLPVDEKRATELFRSACDEGNGAGCRNLAIQYESGRGVPRDAAAAMRYYTAGCDHDDEHACYYEGLYYTRGTTVSRDDIRAMSLYKRSCDGGDARGCAELGWAYRNGITVAKDEARALGYFRQACDANNPYGCASLGTFYKTGNQVTKDEARAADLFRKACDADNGYGCDQLGLLARDGVGLPPDQWGDARAAQLFTKACDHDEPLGCFHLGLLAEDGAGVEKSASRALGEFSRACDRRITTACVSKGRLLASGDGGSRDPSGAVALWQSACDEHSPGGCAWLAWAYAQGFSVTRDSVRATVLSTQACNGDDPMGCREAGELYRDGVGVIRNAAQAVTFFQHGCSLGSTMACREGGIFLLSSARASAADKAAAAKMLGTACDAKTRDEAACAELAKRHLR